LKEYILKKGVAFYDVDIIISPAAASICSGYVESRYEFWKGLKNF